LATCSHFYMGHRGQIIDPKFDQICIQNKSPWTMWIFCVGSLGMIFSAPVKNGPKRSLRVHLDRAARDALKMKIKRFGPALAIGNRAIPTVIFWTVDICSRCLLLVKNHWHHKTSVSGPIAKLEVHGLTYTCLGRVMGKPLGSRFQPPVCSCS
jgi:hypothetical protein